MSVNGVETSNLSGQVDSTPDFTVIFLPDTQHETTQNGHGTNAMWIATYNWIIANKTALNIVAVVSEGDITDDAGTSTPSFQVALTGFQAMIAAGIPCTPGIGNHDYNGVVERNTTNFDVYFGPSQTGNWSQYPFYKGNFPTGSGRSCYTTFSVGSHNYMVLSLQWNPTTADLAWAQGILDANPGYEVILMTHGYLGNSGERVQQSDQYGPACYGQTGNAGQDVWDNFVKINPQIFFVIGGHFISTPFTSRMTDVGSLGQLVHQLMVNYQDSAGNGDGYVAIATISPSKGTISMSFYSTYLGVYDPTSPAYVLSYRPPVVTTSLSGIAIVASDKLRSDGETQMALGNGVTKRLNNLNPTDPIYDCSGNLPAQNRIVSEYADTNKNVIVNNPNHIYFNKDYGGAVGFPRMTTTQRLALASLLGGEVVYDTTIGAFYGYASGAWYALQLAS